MKYNDKIRSGYEKDIVWQLGWEEGWKEGWEEGWKEARRELCVESAKNLLTQTDLSAEIISIHLNLDLDQVLELEKELREYSPSSEISEEIVHGKA